MILIVSFKNILNILIYFDIILVTSLSKILQEKKMIIETVKFFLISCYFNRQFSSNMFLLLLLQSIKQSIWSPKPNIKLYCFWQPTDIQIFQNWMIKIVKFHTAKIMSFFRDIEKKSPPQKVVTWNMRHLFVQKTFGLWLMSIKTYFPLYNFNNQKNVSTLTLLQIWSFASKPFNEVSSILKNFLVEMPSAFV